MADFQFYIEPGDQVKMQKILDGLEAFDTNNEVKKAFRASARKVVTVGRLRISGVQNRYGKMNRPKLIWGNQKYHRPWYNVKKTLNLKVSNRKNSLRTYAGFLSTGGPRPLNKLAHIFDRGTKKRYTKKGWYRGYIFKETAPSVGSTAWLRAVNRTAPAEMKNNIIPTINRVLKGITTV